MAARIASIVLLGASAVFASPLTPRRDTTVTVTASSPAATAWDAGAVHEYPIHASCNTTQHAYIKQGLDEAITICGQARDHILRWGNSSEIYQKYFGNSSTGEPLGWFTKIVDGDKSDVLFRCDNIDGNCNQKGWAGHWRGKNASSETVICDMSYEVRKPLAGMCMFGYDVANGATNTYWASDLLHRLLHIPKVGEGVVEHYSSEPKYPSVLDLAKTNSAWAVRNSDTLQYFALEVYAHDIALPGVGCAGHYTAVSSSGDSHAVPTTSAAASSVSASVTVTVTATAADATSEPASATATATQAAQSCTPHDDHWHCPPGVPEPANPPA